MTGVRVRAVVEGRRLDVEFGVAAGEVLAVLGPNGAGKSTLLHVLAGLVRPDTGSVRVGDRVLTDTATGVQVATHDRRVGLLLQDPLLFPHLDVATNVAFGPRSGKHLGRKESRAAAQRWLAEVDAGDLAPKMPRQLSGGQAQRVATRPRAGRRARRAAARRTADRTRRGGGVRDTQGVAPGAGARRALGGAGDPRSARRRHAGRPRRGAGGRAGWSSRARPQRCWRSPAASSARASRGSTWWRVEIGPDGSLATSWGTTWHGTVGDDVGTGDAAVAIFAPSTVAVHRDKPHGSPRNTIEVVVAELDTRGPAIRVRADEQPDGAPGLAADITVESATDLRLAPGERVYFAVKSQEITRAPWAVTVPPVIAIKV